MNDRTISLIMTRITKRINAETYDPVADKLIEAIVKYIEKDSSYAENISEVIANNIDGTFRGVYTLTDKILDEINNEENLRNKCLFTNS